MDDEDVNPAPEPRIPTVDDLLLLCRLLNEAGAQYDPFPNCFCA